MPKGPRGEKRPNSPVSSMVKAMKVATGIEPEEYVDGANAGSKDELEGDYQIAAMRVADLTERTEPKKSKRKKDR